MAKRLTSIEKDEIKKSFVQGETVKVLSERFECTKLTIIRNLKKSLGESRYISLLKETELFQNKSINNVSKTIGIISPDNSCEILENNSNAINKLNSDQLNKEDFSPISSFLEITPLNIDIDNSPQKEFSSISISEIDFPKVVYMIVDKRIELVIKFLKDYPEWEFLPSDDLNRKVIEIYFDIKIAKKCCNNEQKVIKVPNTDVFKIAAPFLLSRGITRIVSSEKLIAL